MYTRYLRYGTITERLCFLVRRQKLARVREEERRHFFFVEYYLV